MDEIETLVGDAPMPVALDRSGVPRHVPTIVGHSAYRVVRDALHAAVCASEASVAIQFVPGAVIVQIDDDGGASRGTSTSCASSRRRSAAGLRATPEPGGFRVRAWLPTEGQPPSPAAPPAAR